MSFDFSLIIDSIPKMLMGMGLTLQLMFITAVLGTALAVVLLLMRLSGRWYLLWPSPVYIYVFRGTPILVLTTESDSAKKDEGRAAGATGWLVKPFEPEKLLKVVQKVCG